MWPSRLALRSIVVPAVAAIVGGGCASLAGPDEWDAVPSGAAAAGATGGTGVVSANSSGPGGSGSGGLGGVGGAAGGPGGKSGSGGTEDCTAPTNSWQVYFSETSLHCYGAFMEMAGWDASRARCATDFGGDLAALEDAREQGELVDYLTKLNPDFDYWIGLNDEAGSWKWANGDALGGYTAWGVDQPSNGTSEDCVMLDGPTWQWNDIDCGFTKFSLCERAPPQ